jgi:hypothetical protein
MLRRLSTPLPSAAKSAKLVKFVLTQRFIPSFRRTLINLFWLAGMAVRPEAVMTEPWRTPESAGPTSPACTLSTLTTSRFSNLRVVHTAFHHRK